MFETSVVRARVRSANHYRFLLLSFAVHSCALVAVLTATLANTRMPLEAPRQMEMPVFMPVVSIPPALGTPNAQPKPKAAPVQVKAPVTAPAAVTAPQVIPDQVPAQSGEPAITTGKATGAGTAVGVPTGVPGGTGTDTSAVGRGPDVPLPITGDVKAPIVIRRVLPEYPRVAMMGRINGWVIVECIIDKSGHIRDAHVVKGSFAAFEQPALDAVRQWVFSPGTLGGKPVDTIFDLTVTFQVH